MHEARSSDGTQPLLAGTPGYVAPEQLTGAAGDERTDIFQVAAVLYEIVTGQQAFPGASLLERLSAAVWCEPNWDLLHQAVPDSVVATLRRALSREPAARHPTAAALLRELLSSSPAAPAAEAWTVAVLDLEDAQGARDTAWIGSGVAEAIASRLAAVPGLRVVDRDLVLRATCDAPAPPGAPATARWLGVARALACRRLVSGTYAARQPELALSLVLTDALTEQHTEIASRRGLARAGDVAKLHEAERLFAARAPLDFSHFVGREDAGTRLALQQGGSGALIAAATSGRGGSAQEPQNLRK